MTMPDSAFLQKLRASVDSRAVVDTPAELERYVVDYRHLYHGRTPLVLRPSSVAEVAAILALCNDAGVGIVPHGGNTGYCGGSVPDESGEQLVLSLERLNRVRSVDPLNYSMTVEAGCVLARVQEAARDADRFFPLSLAAEGSCQIGGNLSTNAGGTAVLRYGMARDLVLGLEVVLADGRVLDQLRSLRKDNTGYDLKSLFIGAEGTLGVITAATLKLFPKVMSRSTGDSFSAGSRDTAGTTASCQRRSAHGLRDPVPHGIGAGDAAYSRHRGCLRHSASLVPAAGVAERTAG
jgi:FAD/FMN-containing dehydrogenase